MGMNAWHIMEDLGEPPRHLAGCHPAAVVLARSRVQETPLKD